MGWAQDTDVSALKTTPWEREELSKWLDDPGSWDVMIWQRMDRAVRSMADMADLGRFAKKHRKRLIFASGPGGDMLELDFASPMSELIMLILAFAAQLEGQTIMERNQGAAAHLKSLGRWSGGPLPYGFMLTRKVFEDGREGWWLTEHPETATIRRKAIANVIGGRNFSEVRRWLISSKAVTPKNHQNRMAKPARPDDPNDEWSLSTVYDMLRSPIVRGHMHDSEGALIRNPDGSPILFGDPLVEDSTWYELKAALERLRVPGGAPERRDAHELLGVALCGTCQSNMHGSRYRGRRSGELIDNFRCYGDKHEPGQPAFAINRAPVLEYVGAKFLEALGRFRRTQIIHVAGVDHTAEIAELESDLDELSSRLVRLRGSAADAVESQVQGLSDRIDELRERPVMPPREEVVELDTTWGDDWNSAADWTVRREMLKQVGAKVYVLPGGRWTPTEDRLRFEIGTHVDPVQDALDDVTYQESL